METRELRLCDITRYDDVEVGRLRLTIGENHRAWDAIWQTNMRIWQKDIMPLPRKPLTVKFVCRSVWLDCMRVKLGGQTFRYIVPLVTDNWKDFGLDIYLCQELDTKTPLGKDDYRVMCRIIRDYGIRELFVDEPATVEHRNYLNHQEDIIINSKFWED